MSRRLNPVTCWSVAICVLGGSPISVLAQNASGVKEQLADRGVAITLGEPALTAETALEVTYLAQIASWLALQLDFQYVIHPNTDPTVRNGRPFQLRLELAF